MSILIPKFELSRTFVNSNHFLRSPGGSSYREFTVLLFYIHENKVTHHKKKKNHIDTWTNTNKQTTQDNRYQPISPQGTNDIARGVGLLRKRKQTWIVKGHKVHNRLVKNQLK